MSETDIDRRFREEVHLSRLPRSDPDGAFRRAVWGDTPEEEYRSPDENYAAFIEELRRLIRLKYDNVIIITGRARRGKSTLAARIARDLDAKFDVAQVAYLAEEITGAYRRLPFESVILNDESALGLLGQGGHRDDELRSLVQALSIVGIKRDTLICCLPDIRMLDTFVKFGRANFWLHVYRRGRAKVHRAWRGATYRTSVSRLPYDEFDEVSPIGFRSLSRTDFWRRYEEDKIRRVDHWLEEHEFDPLGRIKICPDCKEKLDSYRMALHKCPVREAKAAAAAASVPPNPVVNVPERLGGGSTASAPAVPRWKCVPCEVDFARRDGYERHLRSRGHLGR